MRTMALLAVGLLAGCDAYTCDAPCKQYYGEDGCNRPSVLADGTPQDEAIEACIADCQEAMYRTGSPSGDQDEQRYNQLAVEEDAHGFIQCVMEKDYSDLAVAETCSRLSYNCPWFRW